MYKYSVAFPCTWRSRVFRKYLLIMKLIFVLLTATFLQVSAASLAQRITLTVKNTSLEDVFVKLRKQSNYNFLYDIDMLQQTHPVSISVHNASFNDVLEKCFEGQPVTYVIKNNTIVVRLRKTPADHPDDKKNDVTITGRVMDEKGQPLPGVTVKVKGSANGTVSGIDGRFSVRVANSNETLIFSFVGFLTEEIPLAGKTALDIVLKEKPSALNEVVVVGYGTQKRQDLTGSVSSISEKDIKSLPITSPDQALQGHAAGVQVVQNSSAPGGSTTIRIRGGNSIQGGNEPLYVIDGIPVYNDSGTSGANLNGLSSVDPSDIQAIEILKDASATAIYGSRGANGVVIISTKRGKAGDTRVNFDSYYGSQKVRRKYPLLNATEFAQLSNEASTNDGGTPVYTPAQIAALGAGTDWQDQIFRTAPIQNYNLSINGGDEKTQFAISGNYFNQKGIVLNSDFNRASFRINLDRKISNKIKIGNSVGLTRSKSNRVATDGSLGSPGQVIANALLISPTLPVRAPDGSYTLQNISGGQLTDNPVALAADSKNLISLNRILGSVYGEYTITDNLKLKVLFGLDGSLQKLESYLPKSVLSGFQLGGMASISNSQSFTWLNENTLTYNKTFHEVHSLTLLGGYTMQANRYEYNYAASRNFINDNLGYKNLGAGSVNLTPASSVGTWGLSSFIARANYGYKSKYLLTITGRADGSSRFGANHRYGFFPSASAAWRLSEEGFVKNIKNISDFKIRASYGLTGNQEGIGYYPSLSILSTQNYVFGTSLVNGIGPNQIANPDLKWESTAQTDLGLDIGFFNNRLSFTIDAYVKITSDLLLNVTIPGTSGYTSAIKNLGKVQNKGVEFLVNSQNLTGNLTWSTGFNIAYNKNTVLDIGEASQIFAGQNANIGQNISTTIIKVGQPLGSFYGYVTNGLFQTGDNIAASAQPTAKPGDRKYKDLNGDNKIDDNDRAILGYAQPKYIGGITNNVSFKGVDLSFFFQGVSGNSILNANRFELEYLSGSTNQSRDVLNRWTPTNTNTDIPRASVNRPANRISSRQIENGSYLRLKNLQIGYNFSKVLLSKINIRTLKVYISGENLITWTKYSGYDPEVSRFGQDNLSQGFDYGSYPAAKIFLAGISLGL
jgi:TonB-linked SusC/RagA family outer membrane protein